MKELSKPTYSKNEAEELGYDFEVVEFFKKNYPELLEIMYGHISSSRYLSILSNKISDEKLNEYLSSHKFTDLEPSLAFSIKGIIEFRSIEMGEYVGLPVPEEALKRDEIAIFTVYSLGLMGFLVRSDDEEKIVSSQFLLEEDVDESTADITFAHIFSLYEAGLLGHEEYIFSFQLLKLRKYIKNPADDILRQELEALAGNENGLHEKVESALKITIKRLSSNKNISEAEKNLLENLKNILNKSVQGKK